MSELSLFDRFDGLSASPAVWAVRPGCLASDVRTDSDVLVIGTPAVVSAAAGCTGATPDTRVMAVAAAMFASNPSPVSRVNSLMNDAVAVSSDDLGAFVMALS